MESLPTRRLVIWSHCVQIRSLPTESSRKNLVDGALRMLDIGQAVLGVKQRTMRVTEGNMFLAFVLAHNICCLHQNEESWRFGIDTKRSSQ
jgi:hypothetical protein